MRTPNSRISVCLCFLFLSAINLTYAYDADADGLAQWQAALEEAEQDRTEPQHARNFSGFFLIRIMNTDGRPVENATVQGFMRLWADNPHRRERMGFEGVTDSRGIFRINGETYGSVDFSIEHPDYYSIRNSLGFRAPGLRQELVMRPRMNPVPMAALSNIRIPYPEGQGPFGFDMVRMEWMPPHGTGEQTDLYIGLSFETFDVRGSTSRELRADLRVQFAGEHDGILPADDTFRHRMMSEFLSDYEAPGSGYRRQYRLHMDSSSVEQRGDREANLWYFRIRSTLSPEGEPLGIYGKIYGPILDATLQGPFLRFDGIYIQPQRGNRNMEFDLQNNRARETAAPRWRTGTHLNVTTP